MKTHSYSTLWGYGDKPANQHFSPFASDEEAKRFRDKLYQMIKSEGFKVKRSTLKGQIRPYWEYGVPCGESCTVYELHLMDA
jgi:hypothetical protein